MAQSLIRLEDIEREVPNTDTAIYEISIEYPNVLLIKLSNAEYIYFGYSQEGDDGFTWELTHQGITINAGSMTNQESAKDVAEKLYEWITKLPQCSDCTAFISYKFSTTFANGVYVASAEINCPNCGVSYETNLDGTEEELLEDLLEFGTSRLLEQEELKEYEVQVNLNAFAYQVIFASDEEEAERFARAKGLTVSGGWKFDTDYNSVGEYQIREMDGEGGYMTAEERLNSQK